MSVRGPFVGVGVVLALQVWAASLPDWDAVSPRVGVPLTALRGPDTVQITADTVSLACPPGPCRAEVWVALPPRPGAVVATATMSRRGGVRSRLVVVDRGRRPVAVPDAEAVVRAASPGGPSVSLGVVLTGDGEQVAIRDLAWADARRSPSRAAVVATWWVCAGATTWIAGRAAVAALDPRTWRALAWLAPLVVLGIAMPSRWLDALLLTLPGARPEDLGQDLFTNPTIPVLAQKLLGHALAFAALGFVGVRARARGWVVLGGLVAVAVTTESLQTLLPDRSGKLSDVVVDLAGGVLGMAAGLIRRPRAE